MHLCILAEQASAQPSPDTAPASRTAESPPASAKPPPTAYLEIPIVGVIGEDVLAAGVADGIKFAKSKSINTIVLNIDSPGGSVEEAQAIVKILQSHPELHSIVNVKRALSACVWLVASADEVLVEPTGTIGAAVVWVADPTGKPNAVEAKFLSAYAAEVAALAESKGKPGVLFRAMIEPSAEVWIGRSTDAPQQVVADSPRAELASLSWSERDSADAVLTLTAQESVRLGMASDQTLAERLKGMRSAGRYGDAAMRKAASKLLANREDDKAQAAQSAKVKEWAVNIDKLAARARSKEPRNFDDYEWEIISSSHVVVRTVRWTWSEWTSASAVDRSTMRMTVAAQARWDARASDAVRAWRDIRAGIEDIARGTGRLDDPGNVADVRTRMEIIYKEADDTIRRIQQGY